MENPGVSVVIPCRNGADVIGVQLAALATQEGAPPFEVVIADNGSTDDLRGAVDAWTDRLDVRVVDAGAHAGISFARNIGAREARGDKVLFCDADDAVSPRFVRALAESLDTHEVAGGWTDLESCNPPEVLAWTGAPPRDRLPETMGHLPYAIGACMGVRRSSFLEHGGFDESFVGGHEEVDLAWRVQHAGGTIGFAPDASVSYVQRDTIKALMKQRYRYGKTYAQLFAKHRDRVAMRTPLKTEVRKTLHLLRQGPREWRDPGTRGKWLGTMSWVAGRLVGDVTHHVRAPQ